MNSVHDGMYRLLAEIVEQARRDVHGAGGAKDRASAALFFATHPHIPKVPLGYEAEEDVCRTARMSRGELRLIVSMHRIPYRTYGKRRFYLSSGFVKAVMKVRRDREREREEAERKLEA